MCISDLLECGGLEEKHNQKAAGVEIDDPQEQIGWERWCEEQSTSTPDERVNLKVIVSQLNQIKEEM